jgi:N-formylglutamate deformylase
VRAIHGVAILYDCHSIRSLSPSCSRARCPISTSAPTANHLRTGDRGKPLADLRRGGRLHLVLNGRFKGGWTTRHYGQPAENGFHAIQMELAQSTHLAHRRHALCL